MPARVVLGAQWGDEGKGKVIDALSSDADWVVRFQGGANAGHTLVVNGITHKLHLIPSGVVRPKCNLAIGAGVVVDPLALLSEVSAWEEVTGEKLAGERLFISERTHLISPHHRQVDSAEGAHIGTTGRGIGPAYRDRAVRCGMRVADAVQDPDRFYATFASENQEKVRSALEILQAAMDNISLRLSNALAEGANILLEGAQGGLLDIDHGTYPFVTSSSTCAGNAAQGAGIAPRWIESIEGVLKAYITRVGEGPFPTELHDKCGNHMAEIGREFGTTTGRPRRCGWLDLVALDHVHRINGFDALHITKIDVLGGLDSIKVCTSFSQKGARVNTWPSTAQQLSECEPIWKELPGWPMLNSDEWRALTDGPVQGYWPSSLPQGVRQLIDLIEMRTSVRVQSIGIGPSRKDIISRKE